MDAATDKIWKLIKNNRINEALTAMEQGVKDDQLSSTIVAIRVNYLQNERNKATGVITPSDYNIMRQNVVASMIELLKLFAPDTEQKKILFLSSAPDDQEFLRSTAEVYNLKLAINLLRKENDFLLLPEFGFVASRIPMILREVKPYVLHISAHANPEEGLLFQNAQNKRHAVPGQILAEILAEIKNGTGYRPYCVLLNACHSAAHAQALQDSVDYAIGMDGPIPDRAALAFSEGFYNVFFSEKNVRNAFDAGKNQIALMKIPPGEGHRPGHEFPKLYP